MNIKTNLLLYATSLALAILPCAGMRAQATVGADIKPYAGALIDIKESDTQGTANANRGLGLPRVILDTITPDSPTRFAQSIGGSGSWPLASHTGLTVYNLQPTGCIDSYTHKWYTPETNPELIEHVIYKGLYTWDSTQWQYIGNQDKLAPEVKTFTDNRPGDIPQTYKYRKFGEAGYWMLENMRATVLPKGKTGMRPGADKVPPFSNIDSVMTFVRYAFSRPDDPRVTGDGRDLTDPYYSNMDPEMGYLYTWPAAAYGHTERTDQGYTDQTPTQGICPDGWYLPSDKDWSILEKHIYENAHLYSTHTEDDVAAWKSKTPWKPDWNNHTLDKSRTPVFRPADVTSGNATAMISPCLVPYSSLDTLYHPKLKNKSLPSFKGGFSVKPVGSIGTTYQSTQDVSISYSFIAVFWTSSFHKHLTEMTQYAYNRLFMIVQAYPYEPTPQGGVGRTAKNMLEFASVRCKTDVDPNP